MSVSLEGATSLTPWSSGCWVRWRWPRASEPLASGRRASVPFSRCSPWPHPTWSPPIASSTGCGESSRRATRCGALQVYIHGVRKALREVSDARRLVEREPPGYRLAVTAEQTDIGRFTDAAAARTRRTLRR